MIGRLICIPAVVTLCMLAAVGTAGSALAKTGRSLHPATISDSAASPVVSIHPGRQHPQGKVTLDGSGFPVDASVTITIAALSAGTAETDGTGAFSVKVTVPSSAPPGKQTLVATSGSAQASTTITVGTNWPMLGFTPQGTNANPYENVLNTSNVTTLSQSWVVDAPTSSDHTAFFTAPTEVNGFIYTSLGYNSGSTLSGLYKINAITGAIVWDNTTQSDTAESPPVVYKGDDFWTTDNGLVETNDKTGATVEEDVDGCGELLPVGDTLFTFATNDCNVLKAYDISTGQTVWEGMPPGYSEPTNFVYDSGSLFLSAVGPSGNAFISVNAATGALNWVNTTVSGGGVVAYRGNVIVDNGSEAFALSEASGAVIWTDKHAPGGALGAAANGTIYEVGTEISAISAASGTTRWTNSTYDDCAGTCPGTIALANGVLYLVGYGITTINASTGDTLSTETTTTNRGVVVANGHVYTGTAANGAAFYAYGTAGAG